MDRRRLLRAAATAAGSFVLLVFLLLQLLDRGFLLAVSANLLVPVDWLLGAWLLFPPAVSWLFVGGMLGGAAYFAIVESHRVGKERLGRALLAMTLLFALSSAAGWHAFVYFHGPTLFWWQPDADLKPGQTRKFAEMEFVWIPAGRFTMGGADGASGDQGHRVDISRGFWMGKSEVTQAQWTAVMGDNPAQFSRNGGNKPVENVWPPDCREFLLRLNKSSQGQFRLPTDSEWEYACLAGSPGPYAFGAEKSLLDEYGWHAGNSGGTTHPVGSKTANAWGLHDMHGNVAEWCQADQRPYSSGPLAEGNDPAGAANMVLRGGNWTSSPEECQSHVRDFLVERALVPKGSTGMRLVCDSR
jgi:formylglycine-generating enzyme required for sulfatase activity